MGNPFDFSKLSGMSLAALGVLLLANLLVLLFGQQGEPDVLGESKNPRPAIAAETSLTLVRDLDEAKRASMSNKGETATQRLLKEEVLVEGASELVCRSFGPYINLVALEEARSQLETVGEIVEIREAEIESSPDYLVYLDSDNNTDNARRLLQELESQSIDAYVIAGGEYVNSVSAGVFSSEERANRQIGILTDLGYQPRVVALERVQTVHRLIVRVPEDFIIENQQSEECPVIASAR